MVTAIDDYSAQPGPFVALDEDDLGEEKKEEDGSGLGSGSKSAPLDFTQDPTTVYSPDSSKQVKQGAVCEFPKAAATSRPIRPE
ncbi:hypothetical protein PF005_g33454 [Phytophthora fragariae]|nr:hypothetical protein PF005_g33454 [Phytophthora fragariae]